MTVAAKKLTILIANDDGLAAAGLKALTEALVSVADVYVVAPLHQKSGASNSISVGVPLRVEARPFVEGVKGAWVVDGTPSDCVKLALEVLVQDITFDLLISGINYGPNLGTDVFYSGTVGAAFEGYILGLPAIAASVNSFDPKYDYSFAAAFCKRFILWWQERGFLPHTLFNINTPANCDSAVGAVFVPIGKRIYQEVFEAKYHLAEQPDHYIMKGEPIDDLEATQTDVAMIRQGVITITPLGDDMTNYQALKALEGLEVFGEVF